MKAVFHPKAYEEMVESARFYDEKLTGFGSDFLTAVEQAARRIEQFPKQVLSVGRTSGSDWSPAFRLPFFTNYSLIASSLLPLCINIAGQVIGESVCKHSHQAARSSAWLQIINTRLNYWLVEYLTNMESK